MNEQTAYLQCVSLLEEIEAYTRIRQMIALEHDYDPHELAAYDRQIAAITEELIKLFPACQQYAETVNDNHLLEFCEHAATPREHFERSTP